MKKPLFADWHTTPAKDCLQVGERIDKETFIHFRENSTNPAQKFVQMNEVTDIAGDRPLYNTIFRENIFSPWEYAGQCYADDITNRNPALMPMIYICSRYSAGSREELNRNIEVTKWVCQEVVEGGAIPIAPHLYFPRFMDDNMAEERYFGMEAGKRLMEQCTTFHVVIVDGIVSEGMESEIKYMTETLCMKGSVQYLTRADVERIMTNRLER